MTLVLTVALSQRTPAQPNCRPGNAIHNKQDQQHKAEYSVGYYPPLYIAITVQMSSFCITALVFV